MEFRRFHQFLAVAEEGSFSAAAARLYTSQSGLSVAIAALESDLGVQLFERGRRGVKLTAAGAAFMEPARAAVRDVEQAKKAARQAQGQAAPLRVGSTFVTPGLEADDAARMLQRREPGLQVQITHYGLGNLAQRVAEDEIDVGITPVGKTVPIGVGLTPLPTIPLGVVCPSGHRLDGATDIGAADLDAGAVIFLPPESAIGEVLDGLIQADSRRGPMFLKATGWLNALSLVRRGLGVTLGPLFEWDYYPPGMGLARFAEEPSLRCAIITAEGASRHPSAGKYVNAFVHSLTTSGYVAGIPGLASA